MNVFAKFDEIPSMTLQDIKETKRYGHTFVQTDGQRESSIPPTNRRGGGIIIIKYRNDPKFWTDKSGQTVQTQIRLLLEEQSDQGLHCLLFHLHLLKKYPSVLPLSLNFKVDYSRVFWRPKILELYGIIKYVPYLFFCLAELKL